MKLFSKILPLSFAGLTAAATLSASEYEISIIAENLNKPVGIAVDSSRNIYFSEVPEPGVFGGENAVKRYNQRRGTTTTLAQGEPYPINIALDQRRNVFWTCQTAGVILRYDRRSRSVAPFLPADFAPGAENALLAPTGITVARTGEVLFTELPDPGNVGANMVSVTDGDNITLISNDEPAPTDIVIAPNGNAYWTCNTAGVILERSPAGVISLLKSGLESPTGIALDRAHKTLYYTEIPTPGEFGPELQEGGTGTNRVVALDLRSGETTIVSQGFPLPQDVAVANNGNVYWTCTTAGVIACATPTDSGSSSGNSRASVRVSASGENVAVEKFTSTTSSAGVNRSVARVSVRASSR